MKKITSIFTLGILTCLFMACSSGSQKGKNDIRKVQSFSLSDVKLLESPFREAQELDEKYLLALKPDRLLHMFRKTSGLPSKSKAYGGWESEDVEVRGHSMGHYLSALAKMYQATGNEELKNRGDYIVEELAKCQEAFGESGYLMAYPETFFDRLEKHEGVWAPYYTMHKVMAGLIDQYTYNGNQQALDIVTKMAKWVKNRNSKFSEEEMQKILSHEHGGMVSAFADLYKITENPDHLYMAKRFEHKYITEGLAHDRDVLLGEHVNTQMPKIMGAAKVYEIEEDKYYEKIALNGWKRIHNGSIYVFGGFSNYEHFLRPQHVLSDQLSVESAESCCTYNMLKITDKLFTWDSDPKYADYYERALINHILSSQDKERGMFMYYMAQKPGHWKIFSTPDSSFWCCVGSGMENHAQYGGSVYYHTKDELYVSQFLASSLEWKQKGVKLIQQTRFPEEEETNLTIESSRKTRFTLRVRVPWWAYEGFNISVNGEPVKSTMLPTSWVDIDREWKQGDQLKVEFPFILHEERMPDDPSMLSLMYGPLVLAADLGKERLNDDMRYLKDQRAMHKGPSIYVPDLILKDRKPSEWLKPVPGEKLTFRTINAGVPNDFKMLPYHLIQDQRYSIYFKQTDYEKIPKPWDFD